MGAGGIGGGGRSDCPPGIGRDTVLLEGAGFALGSGAGLEVKAPLKGSELTKRSTNELCCADAGADHETATISAAPQALTDMPTERPSPLIMD